VLSRLPNATHRIDAKSRDGGSRGSSAQALRPTSPAALFLRSDAARWINGANLPVDGGLEA
jgi:NAD(P)-dependent dehydrogenase (short-subunit alcohol dehydrogenase family)